MKSRENIFWDTILCQPVCLVLNSFRTHVAYFFNYAIVLSFSRNIENWRFDKHLNVSNFFLNFFWNFLKRVKRCLLVIFQVWYILRYKILFFLLFQKIIHYLGANSNVFLCTRTTYSNNRFNYSKKFISILNNYFYIKWM